MEERKKENSPLKQTLVYYKNGTIKTEGFTFNDSPIRTFKEFNKQGKITKEINNNIKFKLSFNEIREIVFKTKNVDIYDTRQAVALRHLGHKGSKLPKPYYQIHVLKTLPNGILKPGYSFLLDAETGEDLNLKENKNEKKEEPKTKKGFWKNLLGN